MATEGTGKGGDGGSRRKGEDGRELGALSGRKTELQTRACAFEERMILWATDLASYYKKNVIELKDTA